jgi:hypothetical protein
MAFSFGVNFFSAFRGFHTSQAFEELLDKEDTTLAQVLEEEDVIQEMKNSNAKLVAFLTPERLTELLNFLTVVADDENDIPRARKYPFIANELLSCEAPTVLDMILGNEDLLGQLFSFFKEEAPLNLTLAGYVSQVVTNLLIRNREVMMSFFATQGDWVKGITAHIYSKSVSELIRALLLIDVTTTDRLWTQERVQLIDSVLEKLAPQATKDDNFHAAEVLCELVTRTEGINCWELLVARLTTEANIARIYNYI